MENLGVSAGLVPMRRGRSGKVLRFLEGIGCESGEGVVESVGPSTCSMGNDSSNCRRAIAIIHPGLRFQ